MVKFNQLLSTALFCLGGTALFAQSGGEEGVLRNAKGKITFARIRTDQAKPLKEAAAFLHRFLEARPELEFRLKREQTDHLGITHQRFHQYFQGVRIEGAEYLVHSKNGIIQTINGDFDNAAVPSVTPAINPAQAISKALAVVPAQTYGWEDKFSEARYKEVQHDQTATLYPSPELVIAFDDSIAHAYRLIYKVHVYSAQPLNDYNVYVDAVTGNVAGKVNLICSINTPGTGATLYSGQQDITVDFYSTGLYRLQETRSGATGSARIETRNMQNQGSYSAAVDFSNNTPDFTVADGGLDAHWATEKVYDFFSQVLGRNSYDDVGSTLLGYVHANLPAINSQYRDNDNAFWNSSMRAMTYGDGTTLFRTVTALDVIAHEIGHGICQYSAGLNEYGDGYALNEGLSDIWGACVSNWAAPSKNAWQIGEEIMKNGDACLRSLQNPADGSGGIYADTYQAGYWRSSINSSADIYTNATVLGHWFYLLSVGGAGTNGKGQSYNVSGITIEKAQRIIYRMETAYMTAGATYPSTRVNAIEAARDLFGANSCEEAAVTNAWYAVGVGNAFVSTLTSFTVNGPETICRGGSGTYTINIPAKSFVNWTSTNSVTTIVPAADRLSAVVTNNDGTATSTGIRATVSACSGTKEAIKIVNLGNSPIGIVSVTNAHSCGEFNAFIPQAGGSPFYSYYMELQVVAEGATTYSWTKLSGNQFFSNLGNGKVSIGFKSFSGGLTLQCDANGPCGRSSQVYSFITTGCPVRMDVSETTVKANPDQSLAVFPNPVSDQVSITLPNELIARRPVISITDVYGRRVRQLTNVSAATTNVSLAGFAPGVYMVEVYSNNKIVSTKKIIKQ